jgi:triphosphatase
MRVALRRLRTICALLRGELDSPTLQAFRAEAGWLAKVLGAARDWDVFITQTLSGPSAAVTTDIVAFHDLCHAAEPHRAVAYTTLRDTLAGKRYNRFQLSLRHWIESGGWRNELESRSLAVLLEPSPEFASRVLTRLHSKALKRGAHFRHLRPDARHQLRIALKKLRYAAEFFQGLHRGDTETKGYLECLARLQDALGHDNDASMTWPFLSALGAVMGWQARDRIEVGWTLREHWRRFKTMPTFWTS